MDCLYVQVAQLDTHPCKRDRLPFIHFAWTLSDVECGVTESSQSNGVPPSWSKVYTIPNDVVTDQTNLCVRFFQSRLFMKAEQIGAIEIPIRECLSSGNFDEFVPVTLEYEDMPFSVRIRLSREEIATPEEEDLTPIDRLRKLRTEYFGQPEP